MFPLFVRPAGFASAVALQAETLSWISRVQGLGGQPTSSGIVAVDNFFVAIKPQSYYSKLKLLHLFAGTSTIASAMAPLKHPTNAAASLASLSDYTSSGSGAGIQGNQSGYVDHNFSLFDNLPGSSAAIGVYSKTDGAFSDVYDVGYLANGAAIFTISMKWGDGNYYADCFEPDNGRVFGVSPGAIGFSLLNRVSATDLRYFFAGTQINIRTTTAPAITSALNAFYSFAGRPGLGATPRKLIFICATTGQTPAEVSHFTTQVNTMVGAV